MMILVLGWLISAVWQRNVARRAADENLQRAYAADMNLGICQFIRQTSEMRRC